MSDINISAFKFSSTIDWIEVRVTLAGPSQPQHVRKRMPASWGMPYVKAETEDPSRTARTFTFRVQDPAGPVQFMRDAQDIARPGDPPISPSDVQIVAVEIALDAYHRDHDKAALVAMGEQLLWTQSTWASFPRIATRDGSFGVATASKARWALAGEMATLNLGHQDGEFAQLDQDSEFAQRIYIKTYDTRNGESYRPLPINQHRARYEVTLHGKRLPFATVGQWQRFRFETLQRELFNWRRWRGAPLPSPAAWLVHFPHLGRLPHQLNRARHTQRRGTRPGTEPDTELNRHALNALRRLTRDQMRPLTK